MAVRQVTICLLITNPTVLIHWSSSLTDNCHNLTHHSKPNISVCLSPQKKVCDGRDPRLLQASSL